MPEENLLTTLEGSLRQTRATRSRLSSRLADLEAEAERLRTELAEMDGLASQTEAAMFRILSSMLGTGGATTTPSDAEIEAALRRDAAKIQPTSVRVEAVTATAAHSRHEMPPVRTDIEPKDERFLDRTIPQATALLLREAGSPLHVNEIYNRLLEGSFQFTGQHPTISIAVSLNRNRRFRKVAPGTFDLTIRDAAQAS
ncbi:MAG: winged helix-turn-helix domain-containing protein [Acidobacteriota bacterium]|nr:winged helix-turn-helix domain-containing protein [Acidobacteriota bacterium]